MGCYLPNGFEPLTALHVALRYDAILRDLDKPLYNDYVDDLIYNMDDPNTFDLKYIPAGHTVRFFINGVFYNKDHNYFVLDAQNRKLIWNFTKENGGFDLDPTFRYIAVYDIYYEDNNLGGPDDIV